VIERSSFTRLKFSRTILLAGASLLLSVIPSHAGVTLPVTFEHPREGFSISFPPGWDRVSPELLAKVNQMGEVQYPNWKRPVFHYAYQATNTHGSQFNSAVAIRVSDSEAYRDTNVIRAELEKIEDPRFRISTVSAKFDTNLNAFIWKGYAEFANTVLPSMDGTAAYFLTKGGAIKIFFIAPPESEREMPVEDIIKSVRIEKWAQGSSAGPPSKLGLVLALVSIVAIALVLRYAKPAPPPRQGA